MDDPVTCIRCDEALAVDELGYCGHCHWAVRAEVEEGLYSLRAYLESWARFDDWCRLNPDQAPVAIEALAQLRRLRESGAEAA